jgi:nicotinate-nucleotide adenylyltransferase
LTKQRIGIFGGTFDPPHVGHLIIAESARVQLKLDRVLFVPAYLPPHKRRRASAAPFDRLKMVRLAVRGNAGFVASGMELKRKGISYTIDTVEEVRRRNRGAELFLILGSDNLAEFHTWKSHRELLARTRLIVYSRGKDRMQRPSQLRKARIHFLRGMLLDISSSVIRQLVKTKSSIRYLVPDEVERYILSRKLYRRT